MRTKGRPFGSSATGPQKRSMTAKVVKLFDTGHYKSTAALLAALARQDSRKFTYSHVSGALNKWRPEWIEVWRAK